MSALDEWPKRDRRRFDTSPSPQLTQKQLRERRLAGYEFRLSSDFDIADEVRAIAAPAATRAEFIITSGRFTLDTVDRVTDLVERLVTDIERSVEKLATLLAQPVPPKLPTLSRDYFATSDNSLSSLLVAHAELVSKPLQRKLSRYSTHELHLADYSGGGTQAPDRWLGTCYDELRQFVWRLDRDVRALTRYIDKLDRLSQALLR